MSQEQLDITQFTPPLTDFRRGDSVFINGKRYVFVSDTKLEPERLNGRQPRNRHERRQAARRALTGGSQ